jgi:hypothetical protein
VKKARDNPKTVMEKFDSENVFTTGRQARASEQNGVVVAFGHFSPNSPNSRLMSQKHN